MTLKARRWLFYYAPLILWMGAIFFASTSAGSESNSRPSTLHYLEWFVPGILKDLSEASLYQISYIVRKIAHITEYAILAGWALRAARCGGDPLSFRKVLGVGLFCVAYAITDELHQVFTPGRSASAKDVQIDALGVLLALGLWAFARVYALLEEKLRADSKSEG